jgi:NAD(P)-dependent dehydrogenase (short-subunit alcohol dehydrogenase family)
VAPPLKGTDVKYLADFTVKLFRHIDIGIMAAGVPVAGSILETDTKDLLRATAANYIGFFHLLKYSTPHMSPDNAVDPLIRPEGLQGRRPLP